MDKAQFLSAISNQTKATSEDLDAVKKWIQDYPYFTSARLLYLQSIQFTHPLSFPLEVKKCAAHIGSREKMYELTHQTLAQPIPDLIRGKAETVKKVESVISEKSPEVKSIEPEKLSAKEKVKRILEENRKMRLAMESGTTIPSPPEQVEVVSRTIDLSQKTLEKLEILDPPLTEVNPTNEKEVPIAEMQKTPITEETSPSLIAQIESAVELEIPPEREDSGMNEDSETNESNEIEHIENQELPPESVQPLETLDALAAEVVGNKSNTTDIKKNFFHWLKELQNEKGEEEKSTIEQQKEIIDKFLVKLPGIKPDKSALKKTDQRDLVQQSLREDQEMVTETLAKLYLEQGHLSKALDAFEILLLRFPQKSSFFAGQIREIRKSLKEKGKK